MIVGYAKNGLCQEKLMYRMRTEGFETHTVTQPRKSRELHVTCNREGRDGDGVAQNEEVSDTKADNTQQQTPDNRLNEVTTLRHMALAVNNSPKDDAKAKP
ncbi:hypothetical protein ACE6H2_020710 [Prunus campanulata]